MPSLREAHLRHAQYYIEFTRQHRTIYESLAVEESNIRSAVDWCLEQREWQLLADFVRELSGYWFTCGHWDIHLRCNRVLLDNHGLCGDSEAGERLSQVAEIEEARGNYEGARELYLKLIEHHNGHKSKSSDTLVKLLKKLVKIVKLQGKEKDVCVFLNSLLTIVRDQNNPREQVDILLELGTLSQNQNNYDKADLIFQNALNIARSIYYTVGIIDILRQQAACRFGKLFLQEARDIYEEALRLSLEVGDEIRTKAIREQIAALEALMGRNVFISYSRSDRDFVERLAKDLKKIGLAVWWDEWEVKIGDSIIQKISEGIEGSAYLAVVLSPHSVQSAWVQRELGSALMRQLSTERNIIVLPLLIAECEVPILLREIKWADFRKDYQEALAHLLESILDKSKGH